LWLTSFFACVFHISSCYCFEGTWARAEKMMELFGCGLRLT
jgi:hypothetical protein